MMMLVGKCDGHVDVKLFAIHVEHGDLSPAFDAVLEGRMDEAVQIICEFVVGRKDDDRHVAESVVAFMLEHPLGVSLHDGTPKCRCYACTWTLWPDVEAIAAHVVGDGTDAQRVALADSIREGRWTR